MNWNEKIEINAPIESVWNLFSVENRKRIMPQIVSINQHSPNPKENITVYEETYREGKRDETYLLTEKIIKDAPCEKIKEFSFTIGDMIHTEGKYALQAINGNKTLFVYSGENIGVAFFGKLMLKMAGKLNNSSVVTNFLNLVKKEAEQ